MKNYEQVKDFVAIETSKAIDETKYEQEYFTYDDEKEIINYFDNIKWANEKEIRTLKKKILKELHDEISPVESERIFKIVEDNFNKLLT